MSNLAPTESRPAPQSGGALVSVIIPTYNRARLVGAAVESVLAQTYRPLEVIVVDDGSSDESQHALSRYRDEILLLRHERNRGAPAARNTGVSAARGEYVAFLDSDDLWEPDKLEKQMAAMLAGPGYGFCFCDYSLWRDDRVVAPAVKCLAARKAGERPFEALLAGNFVAAATILTTRGHLDEIGGWDESLGACQDWDLALRLSARLMVAYVDEPLLRVREQEGSISSDLVKASWSALTVVRKALRLAEEVLPERVRVARRVSARTLATYGRELFFQGSPQARTLLVASLQLSPGCGRAWRYLAASMLPAVAQHHLRRRHRLRREHRELAKQEPG